MLVSNLENDFYKLDQWWILFLKSMAVYMYIVYINVVLLVSYVMLNSQCIKAQ